MKRTLGLISIVVAMLFAYWETKYFGYNVFPDSQEEFVCDLVSLLLFINGNILFWRRTYNFKCSKKPKRSEVNQC